MKTLSLALCALLGPVPAFADVTVQYESSSGGYRGMGAYESKGARRVSGAKAREDAERRFTGAVLGRLSGKKEVAQILRVDLGKRWELDLKKKTCMESPIALPPTEAGAGDAEESGPAREEKPTHRVKSASAEVKKTGEAKTINGFKTAKWAAKLVIVVEEIATKKTAEYAMGSDIWATPWTADLRKAVDEEARFQKAYLKKLGMDLSPQDKGRFGLDSARMLLAAAGPEVEKALLKLTRELSAVDGYPVVTETTWRAPAPPASAKGKAPAEDEDDEGSALSDAAGAGSIGGAAMGLLGGMAKKAAKKKAKEKVREAAEPDPGKPAFSVRTEVKKVDVGAIPAETFEIPEGFKKKG